MDGLAAATIMAARYAFHAGKHKRRHQEERDWCVGLADSKDEMDEARPANVGGGTIHVHTYGLF